MSSFRVLTEDLLSGSSLIGLGGSVGSSAGLTGAADAAAQTPAAGAWADFVARADRALIDADEVSGELARALSAAAQAYELCDQATAASLLASG